MKYFKNIVIFSLICLVILVCINNGSIAVHANSKINYAQIKNSNTYLYKSAELNDGINNKWCLIENTYFVKIINNYNDVFYKVEYNNIQGYVRKDSINLVNENIVNPYPNNITFNIHNLSNCYLRKTPKIKDSIDNIVSTIPSGYKNLRFIGKIIGEEAIDFKGSIWFLTEYNGTLGYVYSGYTESLGAIIINNEQVTNYDGYDFAKINPLSNPVCLFIILITIIPSLLILFMVYLPKRNVAKITNKNNKHKTDTIDFYDENL